ncbi:MAG TPA: HAMP domain-containing sensor histidine kinase [Kineosporiaceae bacterium]
MLRTLTARIVFLVAAVAIAAAALTTLAFARVLGATNEDQAAMTIVGDADRVAARLSARPRTAASDVLVVRLRGYTVHVWRAGEATVPLPFALADLARATDDAPAVRRSVAGKEWLIAARPTTDGRVALLARQVAAAGRLTPAQQRRALLGGGLGLVGGVLAGLAVALSITRPLGRLAGAARRMSAGERRLAVPAEGPAEVAAVADALGTLSRALAASEERQRRFLLAVSHELRTPLTAVVGYAEALQDGATPPAEVPRAASVIVTESARLQRRVEDLLALARLEADDFRLEPAPADVGALVRAAAAAWAPRGSAAGVVLSVDVPASGPVVVTDGERVRQVVDVLVDNALKVVTAGCPLILACRGTPDGGARVEVRDGGPGLAPEDLAVAFERGRLTERYRGRRPVGSGVGLALVGELARRMGGSAHAAAAPEGGVAFSVCLPPAPPPPPASG